MFTGIIEQIGTVQSLSVQGDRGGRLVVATALATGDHAHIRLGDSIAVHGPCLTVVEHAPQRLTFDVSAETLRRSSLGELRPGRRVHLERALRLGDRLDGHIVQGHIDGVGRLVGRSGSGRGWEIEVELPSELLPFVVEKGSVALDGVSLTVARLDGARLGVAVVPHTGLQTTLGEAPVGAAVNVETDILGRYVARLLGFGVRPTAGAEGAAESARPGERGLTLDALARGGFLDR